MWPLATAVDALTTTNTSRRAELLSLLPLMAAGNGLVHESVHVNQTTRFSRPEFGWANAMTVVMLEQLLGVDCDAEAEQQRLAAIAQREAEELSEPPPNGGPDLPQYYEQLESGIIHVVAKEDVEASTEDGSGSQQDLDAASLTILQQQQMLAKALGLEDQQQ